MKKIGVWLLLTCSVLTSGFSQSLTQVIEGVRKQYAPDKRVAIFSVEADSAGRLTGKTNLPQARQALLDQAQAARLPVSDQIEVLPASQLGEQTYAIVKVSVANLRSTPRNAAELATQALLGMPLRVWDKKDGWYLVQTPDQYIAWVDFGGLQRLNKADFDQWQAAGKIIFTHPFGFCYGQPARAAQPVSDLVAGDQLVLEKEEKKFFRVRYPDGRTGYVDKAEAQRYDHWLTTARPTEETLVTTAKRLMGIPYLWGGTSVKGMDCSGFTKTVYMLNGQTLSRDASQQVNEGEPVDTFNGTDFSRLQPGDLLFFGERATAEKPERVIHVGMWIGNHEFIHASGQVRISSLDSTAANFDEYELNRFLRARRLIKKVIPANNSNRL